MKHKRNIRSKVNMFTNIPTKVFLYVFIACLLIAVFTLRQNNQTMVDLRNDLFIADKDNRDVEGSLNKLRAYVYGHMNTSLSSGNNTIKPPIQLKYTYERLQKTEQRRVDEVNSKVYTDAQNYCQRRDRSFFGTSRVPCVQAYVRTHSLKATEVPVALYQFDFVSPTWSPDLAGWSLVFSFIALAALVARILLGRLKSGG